MLVSCDHGADKTTVTVHRDGKAWRRKLCKKCIDLFSWMLTTSISIDGRMVPSPLNETPLYDPHTHRLFAGGTAPPEPKTEVTGQR